MNYSLAIRTGGILAEGFASKIENAASTIKTVADGSGYTAVDGAMWPWEMEKGGRAGLETIRRATNQIRYVRVL
jgi:hypothetical protein